VQVQEGWKGAIRAVRRQLSADFKGDDHMTASIRSICLAVLLAGGAAWAQQNPADNPDNPHSTKSKDKQAPKPATNAEIDAAERDNPHHPQNKDREMAGMDPTAAIKNATPQMMLQKLHLTNLEEIEMAKLAEQNGSDRVKGYARTLLRDHQDADVKVNELAKKKGIALSDSPKDPEIRKHMEAAKDELSRLKGPEFDRAFANRMSTGHKRVISMVQAWRQDCRDQDVCNLIDTLLPQLQKHAEMADQLKGPAAMGRTPENR